MSTIEKALDKLLAQEPVAEAKPVIAAGTIVEEPTVTLPDSVVTNQAEVVPVQIEPVQVAEAPVLSQPVEETASYC